MRSTRQRIDAEVHPRQTATARDQAGRQSTISDAASVERAVLLGETRCRAAARGDVGYRSLRSAYRRQAFAVNARGAENVANACARTNARLLYTSTAAVFDGRKQGYREDDEMCPISVYGKTKAGRRGRSEGSRSRRPSSFAFAGAWLVARRSGTNSMLDTVRESGRREGPFLFHPGKREIRSMPLRSPD